MKRIVALCLLAFGFLPLARAQVGGVTAQLTLAQDQLLPDEDMQLKVRVINLSGQDLRLGGPGDWISFSITDDNNKIVPDLAEVPVTDEFTLHSAQAGTPVFNLTPCFNFRRAGHYTIKASIKIPQWDRVIACPPVGFNIINGTRLPNLPEMEVGLPLPPGATNAAPEVRRYYLEKVIYPSGMKLYFQLTDETGARTLRVFPLDRMLTFTAPEVQIDRFSNLHVLHQKGARAFNYCVINPLGQILERQTYDYTQSRPVLRRAASGEIIVAGGVRQISANDIPPPRLGP